MEVLGKRIKWKQPNVLHQVLAREEFQVLLDLRNLTVPGAANHVQKKDALSFPGRGKTKQNHKHTKHLHLELLVHREIRNPISYWE